jgi:hypothetical protein
MTPWQRNRRAAPPAIWRLNGPLWFLRAVVVAAAVTVLWLAGRGLAAAWHWLGGLR